MASFFPIFYFAIISGAIFPEPETDHPQNLFQVLKRSKETLQTNKELILAVIRM